MSGLKSGDIILEIDGQNVNNIDDYRSALYKVTQDQGKVLVEFKIVR